MKHITPFTIWICLIFPTICVGQCPQFDRLMLEADQLLLREAFREALNKLEAAREYCPEYSEAVSQKVFTVFNAIEQKKNEAEEARAMIETAQAALLQEKMKADSALLVASSVIDKIYFYKGKFGLTLKRITNRIPSVHLFGYIDKSGNEVIPFEFEEATPFSVEAGFARVKKDSKSMLLDTTGQTYLLANSLEELTDITEALVIDEPKQERLPENIGSYANLNIILAHGEYSKRGKLSRIPSSFQDLRNLTVMHADYNQITELPSQLKGLRELRILSLSYNQLSTLPTEIGSLTQLMHLDVSNNRLTFLPSDIGTLSHLTYINLGNNKLSRLPEEMSSLQQLEQLQLDGNQIQELPKSIYSLPNLTHLSLWGNQLSALPDEIGNLTQLRHLGLTNNNIRVLPETLGALINLKELRLHGNEIDEIPVEIGKLVSLKTLYLGSNKMNNIPASFHKLYQLQELSLSFNQFTEFPSPLLDLANLEYLNLEGNAISHLPSQISNMKKLSHVDLSLNQFSHFPEELFSIPNLKILRLRGNELTSIPSEISTLSQLEGIDLSNNKVDVLPEEIGELSDLHTLHIDGNKLTSLPDNLQYLEELSWLNVSFNQLTEIPIEMGELPTLERLNLRGNKLQRIPMVIKQMTSLKELDLAFNQIDSLTVGDYEKIKHIEEITVKGNPLVYIHPFWHKFVEEERLVEIGDTAFKQDKFELAYQTYDTLTDLYPAISTYWFTKSFYACFVGKYREAIHAAKKTLELSPEETMVYTNMALGYLFSGEFEKAQQIYMRWKDQSFYNDFRPAKEVFIEDLDDLEAKGITHPDIAQVRKLLAD